MSLDRGTAPRLSLTKFTRKFSVRNREYNKVEDLYDTRIPLHNEEAFQHGIQFKAKFIGSLEIARPTCKIDIITAMRRIRYEYKVKGIRKVRCYMSISTSGVKISKRKKKRSRKKYSEEQLFIMHHPIYRIFYVSHDSQDLKIFSYITREVPDNTFRCNVFKAYKKGLALTVVRSLGQAFDVCHKLNPKPKKKKEAGESSPELSGKKEGEDTETKEAGDDGEVVKEDLSSNKEVPSNWKRFSTDLDNDLEPKIGEEINTSNDLSDLNRDLKQLNFDPFSSGPLNMMPVANGNPVNMDPFQPITATPVTRDSGTVAYPPLTVSNLSTSLPDFPAGVDPAVATANVPPAHMALLGRPRPRPSVSGQQQMIAENMFTDPNQSLPGNESPVSIGEAIDGNPFLPKDKEGAKWEEEKKQFSVQMSMMKEQLESEKAARIQSQARVEHLLMQNKELLSHLQKLMSQLSQIQTLQQQHQQQQQQQAPPPQTTPTSDILHESAGKVVPSPPPKAGSPQTEESEVPTPNSSSPTAAAQHNGLSTPAQTNSNMDLELDFNILGTTANNDPFQPLDANQLQSAS